MSWKDPEFEISVLGASRSRTYSRSPIEETHLKNILERYSLLSSETAKILNKEDKFTLVTHRNKNIKTL